LKQHLMVLLFFLLSLSKKTPHVYRLHSQERGDP
jgi:hypothetical protein